MRSLRLLTTYVVYVTPPNVDRGRVYVLHGPGTMCGALLSVATRVLYVCVDGWEARSLIA